MSRPNQEDLNRPFIRPGAPFRRCQHDGCAEEGQHRAPVSRDRLTEYYWFCLEHVRAYNQAWDYFAGMNEAEIERHRRADTVWQRPSWPFGRFGQSAGFEDEYRVHDGFGFFHTGNGSGESPNQRRSQTEEQKALAVLDLEEPVTFEDVRSRYKTLVKQLHPDTNGADAEAEERLKLINQAYAALKVSFA